MDRPLGVALIGAGLLAAGAAVTIGGLEGGWGPRVVPLLAAATLALSGAAVAASARPPRAEAQGAGQGAGRAVLLLGLAVLYVLAIDRIGYLLATAGAAPIAFALFGVRGPLRLGLAALLAPVLLHLTFFRLLGVFPPLGAWIDLLDWVPL